MLSFELRVSGFEDSSFELCVPGYLKTRNL